MKAAAALALLLAAWPASARESLGVFERWGAFRDERPLRCFAISEPQRILRSARPFASVSHWPGRARGQVHVRLARPARTATLLVGGRSFALSVRGVDAWAPDPRADAAIVAAMRNAERMTVSARGDGGRFSDGYPLAGAATAIDAAALGCARR